jgi:prepilin-type processing-associated H-X9-DG protein
MSEAMEELFVGYLLDALDEPTRREVEAHLNDCPEARVKLALFKQALEPLEADLAAAVPPPLLVERTLARVAETICAPIAPLTDLPQAPPVSPASVGSGRSLWWQRADMLVAVSIIVTIVGVGLTILAKMRAPSSAAMIVECRNNLRHFFAALHEYRDLQGKFPDITKEDESRRVAGMVVPILMDAGVLSSEASIRCPGLGDPLAPQFTLSELRAMSADEFQKRSPSLSMCYAYSLGYRDRAGGLHIAGDAPADSFSQLPIMADRPPTEGIVQNSLNHGVSGQNVLFADGHVRFLPQRTLGLADDIFLNRDNKVAAGLDLSDVVLGYSSARP